MIDRRTFTAAAGVALSWPYAATTATTSQFGGAAFANAIAAIETVTGGRLGVTVIDSATKTRFSHRANERFAMCSTFKFLLAAAVLARVDARRERLDRMVTVRRSDLVGHSPITATYADTRPASVGALAQAMMIQSDNGAANLMLPSVGGPAGLTRWLRRIGDPVTRLDRIEPFMNDVAAGDERDTTSPNAMADTMTRILIGRVLSDASRTQITDWLIDNRTGDARLRAGLRTGWQVGDKTGSDGVHTTNDIAIIWPTGRAPVIVTCFLTGAAVSAAERDAALARVGRALTVAMTPVR